MVYYPTVFIVSTSSPAWNAIRGWAILYFQVVTRARWTTVRDMNVFNEHQNAFSFTCYNFPAAFHVRRVTPWIVRTGKNSWCLIQGCHIGTDCMHYKWPSVSRKKELDQTKCGKEGVNNFGMRRIFVWFVYEKMFFKLSRLYCEQVTDNRPCS